MWRPDLRGIVRLPLSRIIRMQLVAIAWGVALACARAGVAWACVLGLTNEVGPEAHAQWLANRGACEAAARDAVRPFVLPRAAR